MTSIEWLINQLYKVGLSKDIHPNNILFSKAKEIHKEEVKNAYNQGFRDGGNEDWCMELGVEKYSNAEDYYNETFKK
jgi:hypothetical protein